MQIFSTFGHAVFGFYQDSSVSDLYSVQCTLSVYLAVLSLGYVVELFSDISKMYTDSQKHESPLLHTYVINEFLTADRSCTTKYFWKTLIEDRSSHLYASFGTFWVQIVKYFVPQWVFKHSEEFRNRRHFPSKTANCRFSNIL